MDYYYGPEAALVDGMSTFFIAMLFYGILIVAGQVLIALAVYNDAKAKNAGNPVMWALLVGFLGLIPGIVYLCMRNGARNRLMVCPNCRASHPVGFPACPNCGIHNVYSDPFYNPYVEDFSKKAKTFLIIGIVLVVIAIIVMVVGLMAFFNQMMIYGMTY